MGIQIDEQTFDAVLRIFQDHNKISIRNTCIRFSHPSYYQSLPYLLVKDGTFTKFNLKIFSKALLDFYTDALKTVSRNFDKLPEDLLANLFGRMTKNDWMISDVYYAMVEGFAYSAVKEFHKMPEDIKKELSSLPLSNSICLIINGVPSNSERNPDNRVANITLFNFNKIPESSKSVILEKNCLKI